MKPSTELFKLIKSLTKSEKRFFKLFSSLQAGKKNYFRLFDYIDKQEEYDEAELKKFFKAETFIKHLPSEKNHLYKQILKSLRQFHGGNSVSNSIMQEIKNIEILYDKALFKEANKFLKRTKAIAQTHEEFYYLTDLLAWEKILIEESFESGDFDIDLNKVIEEESLIIKKLQNLAEYHILYSKINAAFRSDGYTKNSEQQKVVQEISNHPLVLGKNTALSVKATSICYYIQGLCALMNRDFSTSVEKFLKVKTVLDKNPKIKHELSLRYLLTLSYLMHSYAFQRDFSSAHEVIKMIKNLRGKKGFGSLHISSRINNLLTIDQMILYNRQSKFTEALKVLEENSNQFEKLIDRSSREQRLKYYYSAAYTLFALRDFKEGLRYINMILNDNKQQLRQDLFLYARVLEIMLHFELGNFTYIEYTSSSALRYLNKFDADHKIEKEFVKQLRKISKSATQIAAVPMLKQTLENIRELLKDEKERVILNYMDIPAWLESKITGESFDEITRMKLKRKMEK